VAGDVASQPRRALVPFGAMNDPSGEDNSQPHSNRLRRCTDSGIVCAILGSVFNAVVQDGRGGIMKKYCSFRRKQTFPRFVNHRDEIMLMQ
jgi:hypothetical protein